MTEDGEKKSGGMSAIDDIFKKLRKPHRIFISNIDSEIRSICFPNYRRHDEMIYNEAMRKKQLGKKR